MHFAFGPVECVGGCAGPMSGSEEAFSVAWSKPLQKRIDKFTIVGRMQVLASGGRPPALGLNGFGAAPPWNRGTGHCCMGSRKGAHGTEIFRDRVFLPRRGTASDKRRQGGSLFLAQPLLPARNAPAPAVIVSHRLACMVAGGRLSTLRTRATPGRDCACLNANMQSCALAVVPVQDLEVGGDCSVLCGGSSEPAIIRHAMAASCTSSARGILQDTNGRAQEGRTLAGNKGRHRWAFRASGLRCVTASVSLRPLAGLAIPSDAYWQCDVMGSRWKRLGPNPPDVRSALNASGSGVAPGEAPRVRAARPCRSSAGVASHAHTEARHTRTGRSMVCTRAGQTNMAARMPQYVGRYLVSLNP